MGRKTDSELLLISLLSIGTILTHYIYMGTLITQVIFCPVLIYFSLRIIFSRFRTAASILLFQLCLYEANSLKLTYNTTELVIHDFIGRNLSLPMTQYLNIKLTIFLIGFIGSFLCLVFDLRKLKKHIFISPSKILGFILPTLIGCQFSSSIEAQSYPQLFYDFAGIEKIPSNPRVSIREVGLLNHLLQTMESLKIPNQKAHNFYSQISTTSDSSKGSEPFDIFLIACESCFTTLDKRLETPIIEILNHGFKSANMISPVYGGNTAEAEFEILTGLPSLILPGVKYQYFADQMKANILALPRVFQNAGYKTNAFHNFKKTFWNRDIVYPKLGFENIHFSEDMNIDTSVWPGDEALFEYISRIHLNESLKNSAPVFDFILTVGTHGPYGDLPDYELDEFKIKLKKTTALIIQLSHFLEKRSKKIHRPYLIIVLPDHKPHLPDDFVKSKVFPESFYRKATPIDDKKTLRSLSPEEKQIVGQVPLFIKSSVSLNLKAGDLISKIENKPFYCLPAYIHKMVGLNDRFFKTLQVYCTQKAEKEIFHVDLLKISFPEGLIYENLFATKE